MSNKTEEFDSVGIAFVNKLPTMEKIQEIIGNHPNSNLASSSAYGPWRQPRSVNHKYCDSCGESGDLMCCDQCPASFHLECLDPPMSEEDVPSTCEFVCKRCTNLNKIRVHKLDDEVASTCSNTSGGSGPTAGYPPTRKRPRKKNSTFDPPSTSVKIETDEIIVPSSESPIANAFQMLIAASKYTNPKEFELLKEHCINDKIPGSYKSDAERKQKGVIELENGIVPLPLKFCHTCKRTCRVAPLLQCDFCPLLFHLDCLDPPLAVMPPRTDRWMCPVHAEQIIDDHVVTSARLSERVRLWNEFARRDDPDTKPHNVKLRFLRRVTTQRHRRLMTGGRPYTRPKIRVHVPEGVKMLYQHPPILQPRLGDAVEPANSPLTTAPANSISSYREEDKDTFLKAVLKFNTDALKHFSTAEDDRLDLTHNSDNHSELPTVVNGESQENVNCNDESSVECNRTIFNEDIFSLINKVPHQKGIDVSKLDQQLVYALAQRQIDSLTQHKEAETADSKAPEHKSSPDAVQAVPLQDGRIVMVGRKPFSGQELPRAVLTPISGGESFPMMSKRLAIGSDYNQDICLFEVGHCNYVSPRHAVIFYDKHSRLFELLNYSGHGTVVDSVLYSCDLSSKSQAAPRNRSNRLVRSLAALTDLPVEALRKQARRKERPIRQLARASDSPDSAPSRPCLSGPFDDQSDDLASPAARSQVADEERSCHCSASSPVLGSDGRAGGLEGSAVLHHGSVLKFGCLQFLFAVVDSNFAAQVTT